MPALPSLTWHLLPNPASFCAFVVLCPAGMGSDAAPGQGLRLQGFPGTRQCGSLTRAMADRSQLCCTPAWLLKGSKSLPHVLGPLLPPHSPTPALLRLSQLCLCLEHLCSPLQDPGRGP